MRLFPLVSLRLVSLRDPVSEPPVRVVRHEDGYLVRSELPGYSPEDLAVESHGQTLRLQGRRMLEGRVDGASTAEFVRAIELPEDAALGEASATLRHGVLTLRVPLKPSARPREVPVTSA